MYRRKKRLTAFVLAVVLVWNNFSVVGTGTGGLSQSTAAQISRQSIEDSIEETFENDTEETTVESEKDSELQVPETTSEDTSAEAITTESLPSEEVTEQEDSVSEEQTEENTEEITEVEDNLQLEEELLEEELVTKRVTGYDLPSDLSEIEQGKVYLIRTYQDVAQLQEYSKQSSLEGCIFHFGRRNDFENIWEFYDTTIDGGFTGFGDEEHPFLGTFSEDYANSVTFKMKRPLFECLGSGATLENFKITLENSSAGIANVYKIVNEKEVVYSNVKFTSSPVSTVSNASGIAGALYGEVKKDADSETGVFTIGKTSVPSLTDLTVTGRVAGGYVGQIDEDVEVQVYDVSNVAKRVKLANNSYSKAAGGVIGKLESGSTFTVMAELTYSKAVAEDMATDSDYGITVSGATDVAEGCLIGACDGATVTSKYKVTVDNSTNMYVRNNGTVTRTYIGGYIGWAKNSKLEIEQFQLKRNIRQQNTNYGTYFYAGGVIGYYSGSDASLTIRNVGIDNTAISVGNQNWAYSRRNHTGGIAGGIDGDHVNISYINRAPEGEASGTLGFYPNLNSATTSRTSQPANYASGGIGGIAGYLHGKDINVSNVSLLFTEKNNNGSRLAGRYTGGLFGYVDTESKMTLTDISFDGFTMQTTTSTCEYCGGLLGYVMNGCVVKLDGEINLENINYNSLGSYGSRGYVVGRQAESLIYLEIGADLKRNTYVTNWLNQSGVWETDYRGYNRGYVIDDIGTYGSGSGDSYGGVYQNVKDSSDKPVIQYDLAYGSEVSAHKVKKADGAYQLEDSADVLCLAIALGTFVYNTKAFRFGVGNCFDGATTADDLLKADYKVLDSINLGDAGIYSLSRNDKTDIVFSGTMTGVPKNGRNPVITLNSVSKQPYGGLFPFIKGSSSESPMFQNLTLAGNMCYHTYGSGGLAAIASGALKLQNVNTEIEMRTSSYSQYTGICYGGMIGQYIPGAGNDLVCDNCEVKPVIQNVRTQQVVGGLVGYVQTANNVNSPNHIELSTITVGSRISANTYLARGGSKGHHARMAGLIAYVGYSKWSDGSYETVGYYASNNQVYMDLTDITVKDANVSCVTGTTNASQVYMTGGLLGYAWMDAVVQFKKTGTGSDSYAVSVTNSKVESLGFAGGLITVLEGKLDATAGVKLDGLTMQRLGGYTSSYAGFLLADGRRAFVDVDAAAYAITTASSATGYSNFDEIVGWSRYSGYESGGIVNIRQESFRQMGVDDAGYSSYRNQVINGLNSNTRYYYNLFDSHYDGKKLKVTGIASNIATATVASPEAFMIWHVYSYSVSEVRRFVIPYIEYSGTGTMPINVTGWNLTVSGTNLDMKSYSYYPTKVTGGSFTFKKGTGDTSDGITLTLYGEWLDNEENNASSPQTEKKRPSQATTQHYMMHAGLFFNANNVRVNTNTSGNPDSTCKLNLRGTITNLGTASGAIFSGSLVGSQKYYLSNIECKGLRVAGYNNGVDIGLLVSNVTDGTLTDTTSIPTALYMNGITALDDTYADGQNKAAAALIGTVGSASAKNVVVEFKNMQISEIKATTGIFEYATFISNYNTLNNSDQNKSYGLYTFTKNDASGSATDRPRNTTWGAELQYGVKYLDGTSDDTLTTVKNNALAGIYLPYVRITKNILVNPERGDLTTGCGTYEDPYVISTKMQFIMLCAYLSSKEGSDNGGIFGAVNQAGSWKVNPIGGREDDEHRCILYKDGGDPNVDSEGHTITAHTPVSYGDTTTKFPTREELRKAYYKIAPADDANNVLNFATYDDVNEYVIMKDFSGLGSKQYPFSGVMVGEMKASVAPTIILPALGTEWDNYGFIQYMKGGVVKDLQIQVKDSDVHKASIILTNGGAGGGVAAIVLGGDNIIDNVTVDTGFQIKGYTGTMTGGYVGLIQAGSVIIRNLTTDNVKNHQAWVNASTQLTTTNQATYPRNSQVIGWVQDGYVVYEGTYTSGSGDEPVILENANFEGSNDLLPFSYSFPLLNGTVLEKESGGEDDKRITVSGDNTKGFEILMHNSAQLEVAALALNSGAFSIQNETNVNHLYAYDETAICRKAKYDSLGKSAFTAEDYQLAIKSDDYNSYYPYVYYKYMSFESGYESTQHIPNDTDTDKKRYSYLNWHTTYYNSNYNTSNTTGKQGIGNILTTYKLAEKTDYVYDLSDYKWSFRGFGELYNVDLSYRYDVSRFRANFDGQGQSVKIKMDRGWDSSITTVGMFNDLTTVRTANKVIGDEDQGGFEIKDLNLVDSTFDGANYSLTGALAGSVKGIWRFTDVTLQSKDENSRVTGKSYTGGLVGKIQYYSSYVRVIPDSEAADQKIEFTRCKIKGKLVESGTDQTRTPVRIEGPNYLGGLVGYVEGSTNVYDYTHFGTLRFEDCEVYDSEIYSTGTTGQIGGFVGKVGDNGKSDNVDGSGGRSYGSVTIKQTDTASVTAVKDTKIGSRGNYHSLYSVGGLIGVYTSYYSYDATTSYPNTRLKVDKVVIDGLRIDGRTSLSTERKYGVGGIVGEIWSYGVTITDTLVKGSTIGLADFSGETETDGVITTDATKDSAIRTRDGYDRLPTGGMIGLPFTNEVNIQDSSVEVCNIGTGYATYSHAGGLIGDNRVVNKLTMTNITSKDNTITSDRTTGGVIGINRSSANTWTLNGITVEGCKMYSAITEQTVTESGVDIKKKVFNTSYANESASAGGVLGRNNSTVTTMTLQNICVGGKSQIAAYHAGGVIGYVSSVSGTIKLEDDIYIGYTKSGAAYGYDTEKNINPDTEHWPVLSDGTKDDITTTIYGCRYAGGLYGYNDIRGKESSSATVVIHGIRMGVQTLIQNNTNLNYIGAVGGVAGYRSLYGECKYDNLTVENCVMAAKDLGTTDINIACGGIFGIQRNGDNTAYFYAPHIKDNSFGYLSTLTNMDTLLTTDVNDENIKLFYANASNISQVNTVRWEDIKKPTAENDIITVDTKEFPLLSKKTVGNYALRIGNYIGVYASSRPIYILHPKLEYSNNYKGSRPVIDIANQTFSNAPNQSNYVKQNYGYDYPYAWQRYCHIIYLNGIEETKADDIVSEALLLNRGTNVLPVDGTGATDIAISHRYLFSKLDSIVENSEGTSAKPATGINFVNAYYLNAQMDGTRSILGSDQEDSYYEKTLRVYENNTRGDRFKVEGVEAVLIDGVSPQTALDSSIGILTGMGGIVLPTEATASKAASVDNGALRSLTCTKAVVTKGGKIVKYDSSEHHVASRSASKNQPSLKVASKYITATPTIYDEDVYDGELNTDGSIPTGVEQTGSTITLLTYEYGWTSASGKVISEVIYVPVFSMARINFYSDIRIMEGERYSVEDAQNDSLSYISYPESNIRVTQESDFTLFIEMAYSKEMDKYPNISLDKVLKFENIEEDRYEVTSQLPKGLKLTMVDVQTGRPYYYTVESGDQNGQIPFTAFKAKDGTAYKLRTMSEINKNVMYKDSYQFREEDSTNETYYLERFFIFADASEVTQDEEREELMFRIRVDTDGTAANSKKFIDRTEESLTIAWARGLKIGFYDKMDENHLKESYDTMIDGKISMEDTIKIDTSIQIEPLSYTYWAEKQRASTYIDSVNNGKYLDVAVYLQDGANQIKFPPNTVVRWTIEHEENDSTDTYTKSDTISAEQKVVYGYLGLNGPKENGSTTERIVFPIDQITETIPSDGHSYKLHFELDFSNADLDEYVSETYKIVAKLRRTPKEDSPESGEVVDTIDRDVMCVSNKEYAVALQVEDTMQLGINTYNETTHSYQIPFTTKLDFSNWIRIAGDLEKCTKEHKRYQVRYQLKRKEWNGEKYVYLPIDENDAGLLGDGVTLRVKEAAGSEETLQLTEYEINGEKQYVYQMTKGFDKDEIETGTDDVKHVVSWGGTLEIDTEKIQDADFSNYRLDVSIIPFDYTENGTEPGADAVIEKTWTDFFIFTIAKLKTDM